MDHHAHPLLRLLASVLFVMTGGFAPSLAAAPARGLPAAIPIAASDEERVEVGEHGGTIDLGAFWRSSDADLGFEGDGFAGRSRFRFGYMAVIEQPTAFTGEGALLDSASLAIEGVRASSDGFGDLESREVTEGDRTIVIQHFKAEMLGQTLRYAVAVTGQDGLRHMVMAWKTGDARDAERLADEVERLARSLTYPGPDSAWAARMEPVEHTLSIGSSRVTIARRPALLDLQEDPGDALIGFVAPEYDFFVNLLPREDTLDPDLVLDDAIAIMLETLPDLEVVDRFETAIGERYAVGVEYRSTEYYVSGGFLYAVQLDDTAVLDLRLVYEFDPSIDPSLHDELLDSIAIETSESSLSFLRRRPFEAELSDQQRAFLSACEPLGTAPSIYQNYFPVDDGWVAGHTMGIDHLSGDFSTWFSVYEDDWVPQRSIGALLRGRIVTVSSLGEKVEIGGFDRAPRTSALSGDDVWLSTVRGHVVQLERIRSASLPWMHDAQRPLGSLRLRLTSRSLWERHETRAQGLMGSPKDAVLIGVDAPTHTGAAVELVVVATDDGATAAAGLWDLITVTAAVDDGWLVTGTPHDAARGVYHVGFDGARELLVGGVSIEGVGQRSDGAWILACGWRTDPEDQLYEIFAIDPAACARSGAACRVAGPAEVDRVAREVLDLEPHAPLLLESRDRIHSLASRARASWRELLGVEAPIRGEELTNLVIGMSGYRDHTRHGRALLALLVAAHALDHGGVLAEPLALGVPPEGAVSRTRWTALGLSFDPVAFVDRRDEVPYGHPHVTPDWVESQARGRTLVLGSSRAAVDAACEALGDLEALARVEELPIAEVVELVKSRPVNRHLRDRIVLRLLAVDRLDEARAVLAAVPVDANADPREVAIRQTLAAEADVQGEERVESLLAALHTWPDELELILLLGHALEARAGEGDLVDARRCYTHVSNAAYGIDAHHDQLMDAADAALERLME